MVVAFMTKATTCRLIEIGLRMRTARESLGLSQSAVAKLFGGSDRTYQKNERGLNEPGICLAGVFIRAGINANWLLTGEGPMLLKDLEGGIAKPEPIDERVLAICIQGISEADPNCPPHKAARLAVEFYARFKAMEKEKDQAA